MSKSHNGTNDNSGIVENKDDASLSEGYVRYAAVRLMLPGHHGEDARIYEPNTLVDPITELLEKGGNFDRMEYLCAAGKNQQEHFVIGHSDSGNHSRAVQHALGDYQKHAAFSEDDDTAETDEAAEEQTEDTGKGDGRAEYIKRKLENHLPKGVRPQICDLDFSTVGEIPIPTSRLLQAPDQEFVSIDCHTESAVHKIISELCEKNIPHILQVLIEPAGKRKDHDYLLSARLAVFDEDYGVGSGRDLESHIDQTYEYDISEFFEGPSSSNFQLPVGDALDTAKRRDGRRQRQIEQYDVHSIRPGTVKDLAVGFNEYQGLLAGLSTADDRYKELFDGYARIAVTEDELDHFLVLVPGYYEFDPWGRVVGSDGIGIITEQLGGEVPGTRQTFGVEDADDTRTPREGTNEESEKHQELVNSRVEFLVRQGYRIIAVDQESLDVELNDPDPTTNEYFDGDSQPDIVHEKQGQIGVDEISVGTETKPASLLVNLCRADYYGYPVTVVTEDQASAEKKIWGDKHSDRDGPVLEPCKETDGWRTRLYNWTRTVKTPSGVYYLLPRDATEAEWWITPKDRVQLTHDGTTLAEGEATDPAHSYDYATPRLYQEGTEWIVESATGEELDRYRTKQAALNDGYTLIRIPLIPTRLCYLSKVAVEYEESNRFKKLSITPEWARRHREKPSLRYEAAVEDFIELYTVEAEGETIPLDELRDRFDPWYTAQTDLTKPNETWFGRAVRANHEVKEPNNRNKQLADRTFRFSAGLVSPDLPFVDPEESGNGTGTDDQQPTDGEEAEETDAGREQTSSGTESDESDGETAVGTSSNEEEDQ